MVTLVAMHVANTMSLVVAHEVVTTCDAVSPPVVPLHAAPADDVLKLALMKTPVPIHTHMCV